MEETNWQMHLSYAENFAEQLLKFLGFGVLWRTSVKLNHALDNVRREVSFEILLDVLFPLDRVGNRVEIPLFGKVPGDDIAYSVFEKSTGKTSIALPSHGIWRV